MSSPLVRSWLGVVAVVTRIYICLASEALSRHALAAADRRGCGLARRGRRLHGIRGVEREEMGYPATGATLPTSQADWLAGVGA